jgi:hypothetical protein
MSIYSNPATLNRQVGGSIPPASTIADTYFYHPFRLPKNMAEKLLRKSVSDNFSILAYGL